MLMNEVLTTSGAVIHTDPDNKQQQRRLPIAIAALGGAVSVEEIEVDK